MNRIVRYTHAHLSSPRPDAMDDPLAHRPARGQFLFSRLGRRRRRAISSFRSVPFSNAGIASSAVRVKPAMTAIRVTTMGAPHSAVRNHTSAAMVLRTWASSATRPYRPAAGRVTAISAMTTAVRHGANSRRANAAEIIFCSSPKSAMMATGSRVTAALRVAGPNAAATAFWRAMKGVTTETVRAGTDVRLPACSRNPAATAASIGLRSAMTAIAWLGMAAARTASASTAATVAWIPGNSATTANAKRMTGVPSGVSSSGGSSIAEAHLFLLG